eukprot:tig00000254_g22546.t1
MTEPRATHAGARHGENAVRWVLEGHTDIVNSVAMSPDDKFIASCGKDGTVVVWDVSPAEIKRRWASPRAHQGKAVWSVAFTPDGKRLISGGGDGRVNVYDVTKGNELVSLRGHTGSVYAVAASKDGGRIVSGGADNLVSVRDAVTGRELHSLKGHTNWVRSVAISEDGTFAVSTSDDKTVRVWNMEDGEGRYVIRGHTNWVKAVAITPDSTRIVTGSEDKTIAVWDAETGQELVRFKGSTSVAVWCLAISPDSLVVASGGADKVGPDPAPRPAVPRPALSPCLEIAGRAAFVRGLELPLKFKVVSLWDIRTGKEVRRLAGHTNDVHSIAFSTDGQHMISGGCDQSIRVYHLLTPPANVSGSLSPVPGAAWQGGQAGRGWDTDPEDELAGAQRRAEAADRRAAAAERRAVVAERKAEEALRRAADSEAARREAERQKQEVAAAAAAAATRAGPALAGATDGDSAGGVQGAGAEKAVEVACRSLVDAARGLAAAEVARLQRLVDEAERRAGLAEAENARLRALVQGGSR